MQNEWIPGKKNRCLNGKEYLLSSVLKSSARLRSLCRCAAQVETGDIRVVRRQAYWQVFGSHACGQAMLFVEVRNKVIRIRWGQSKYFRLVKTIKDRHISWGLCVLWPRTNYKPQERVYHPPFPYDLKSHILVPGALWISYLYPYSKEHRAMFLCFMRPGSF